MFSANVKIDFNTLATSKRVEDRIYAAQLWLDEDVAKESNEFCPVDQGTLRNSVYRHSKFGSGLLKWVTPYARRQYYGIKKDGSGFNYATVPNPKATSRWFEKAKTQHLSRWIQKVQDIISGKWKP